MSGEADTIRPGRDYLERTIATVRNHRSADNCWPQWANIFADEIEWLWAENERYRALIAAHRQEFIVECEMRGYQDAADVLADFERDALAGRGDA